MPFTRPTLKEIYTRVKNDMETRINAAQAQKSLAILQVKLLSSSLIGVLCVVFAGIAHLLYGYISYLMKQILPDTAEDTWLLRHARLYGLTQQIAIQAKGTVVFSGVNDTILPAGTIFQDENLVQFATDKQYVFVHGVVYAEATAVIAGLSGNTTSTSFTLVTPLDDVDSNILPYIAFTGGADQETIEELRARLLYNLRNPTTGGIASDYVKWALEVNGIRKAWCIPVILGPGTVGVFVAGADDAVVPSETLDACTAHILTKCPIGANPSSYSIIRALFKFYISVPSYTSDDIKNQMISNVKSLFDTESKPLGTIPISHLHSALITSGVFDYNITAMKKNNVTYPVGDIIAQGYELAIFDSIIFADL